MSSKSKTPIDALLDSLEYEAVKMDRRENTGNSELPYVTHEGVLCIADKKLRVYKLSTGERVIDADDIENFFDNPFE